MPARTSLFSSYRRGWLAFLILACCPWSVALADTQATLDKAWIQTHIGEYDIALRLFKEIENDKDATPDQKLQAMYGEAHVWNYRTDESEGPKGRELYAELIKKAPAGNTLADWSDLESVQSQHFGTPADSRDYKKIAQDYLDLSQRRTGTPAGDEAYLSYLLIQQSALKLEPKKVIEEAEAFIHDHPTSPWVSSFYSTMAGSYNDLKDYHKEVECMIASVDALLKTTSSLNVDNSTTYYQIAYLAEFELGDFNLARQYYNRLIQEYTDDQRVFPSKQALARMDLVETALKKHKTISPDTTTWTRPGVQP